MIAVIIRVKRENSYSLVPSVLPSVLKSVVSISASLGGFMGFVGVGFQGIWGRVLVGGVETWVLAPRQVK